MWKMSILLGMTVAVNGIVACQHQDSKEECACPAGGATLIQLACGPMAAPVVNTTGACTAAQGTDTVVVTNADAGACTVELTFGSGATSSVTIDAAYQWEPCGSDPHGCGQVLVVAPSNVSIEVGCSDSGSDVGPSE
jgi:hypothetical protein